MDFQIIIAASVAANRFAEFVKPNLPKAWNDDTRKSVLVLIAVIAGIMISLMSNLNLFAGIGKMPELAGVILTGVLAGFGADVVNAFVDVLYGWKDNVAKKPQG